MSDLSKPFGHEVTDEHVIDDPFAYDSEVEFANAAINEQDKLGYLLPSQFATSDTVRLYEVPADDKSTEGTK